MGTTKEYREANKEKIKEQQRRWYSKHREEALAYYYKWRANHLNYMKEFAEKHRHPCLDCGILISRKGTRCKVCAQKLRWKTSPIIKTKAERRVTADGYIYIYRPDHKNANIDGYVREHLLVWEEAHGKPLPEGWIIHHLNGIMKDNRSINLVGLPDRKHRFVLAAKAKRIQELEALLNGQSQLI